MLKKNYMVTVGLFIVLELISIISAINNIQARDWKTLMFSILAIVSLIFPIILAAIANKNNIVLPSRFREISLIFIFLAQYFGELKKLYLRIWWWDLLLHIIFGTYAVIIALHLTQGIIIKDEKATIKRFKVLNLVYAFSFSVTVGTLWEMFEFIGDYLFKSNMIKGGLNDTSTDLLVHTVAAFITCIIYYNHNIEV